MTDFSEETLKIIEEKGIKPKAKWQFLLKDYVVWFLFIASIVTGALAVATIIFILTDHDWEAYRYLDRSLFEHIFISIPYFWLAIFSLFIFAAYHNLKHTRGGYRYEIIIVVGASIFLSAILGITFFASGLDSEVHDIFSAQVPFYDSFVYTREDIWRATDKGLLGGQIISIKDQNDFMLRDFNGKVWQIQGQNLVWPVATPTKGIKIKLIGIEEGCDCNRFVAKTIGLWDESQER